MYLSKKILLPLALVAIAFASWGFISTPAENAQPNSAAEINWVGVEEAAAAAEKDGKKILIDMYTDWCGWCKRMDASTYVDPAVVKYVNDNYHAVKFDAESKEAVTINGVTYKYNSKIGRRGVHELAVQILNGKLSYPTTSFLNPDLSILTNVAGFQQADAMMVILSFLGEDHYKNVSWEDYQKFYDQGE